MILLIDFEKAFDSISWSFMFKALRFFNFGPNIIRWVKTCYTVAKLWVIQKGIFSDFFNIGRGCRQGDPISPYLFNICVEIMGIMIRQNDISKEYTYKEISVCFNMRMIQMFLDGTETSSKSALDLLFQFSKYSGLQPNFGKTKAIWIGPKLGNKDILCSSFKIQWTNEDFNVLGIKFNSSLNNITSILLPKLTHLFITLPTPSKKWLNNWKKLISNSFGMEKMIKYQKHY